MLTGWDLQCSHQPVGLRQELLHILKSRPASGTGSEVLLDFANLVELQLTVEQGV
jgi:hypothetical protein